VLLSKLAFHVGGALLIPCLGVLVHLPAGHFRIPKRLVTFQLLLGDITRRNRRQCVRFSGRELIAADGPVIGNLPFFVFAARGRLPQRDLGRLQLLPSLLHVPHGDLVVDTEQRLSGGHL